MIRTVLALIVGLVAWGEVAHATNRATGRTGTVIVVETRVSEERYDRGFVAGLQADARGDHLAAKDEYERAKRLGRCGPRCSWHLHMTELVLRELDGARQRPEDVGANVGYAIQLHNKLVSLRLDLGHMPPKLVAIAKRHYRIALDLAAGADGAGRPMPPPPAGIVGGLGGPLGGGGGGAGQGAVYSEVLLGFAAFHGELGDTDVAMRLYRQIDLDGLETSTQVGNLAYFYTTVGRTELAFSALERALMLDGPGGHYKDWALRSDDYHHIRHLPRFKELLELY